MPSFTIARANMQLRLTDWLLGENKENERGNGIILGGTNRIAKVRALITCADTCLYRIVAFGPDELPALTVMSKFADPTALLVLRNAEVLSPSEVLHIQNVITHAAAKIVLLCSDPNKVEQFADCCTALYFGP